MSENKEMYYVISSGGENTNIEVYSKSELLNNINNGECESSEFLSYLDIGAKPNTAYWGFEDILIIKGKVIVPKKEAIVKYDIE